MACIILVCSVSTCRFDSNKTKVQFRSMDTNIENALIKKKILSPGKNYIPLILGTRVRFHFRTVQTSNGAVLDDSRKMGKPMELVLGKKFKLEVWEVIVQKMAVDEVAKFTVDKSLVREYPFISKTLRDIGKQQEERKHCCGMTLQSEGIGYKDLDEYMANPCDLEFIIELQSIELPQDYEKDIWQMTEIEKRAVVPELRERGNKYYKDKDLLKAEECYSKALVMLEQMMLREKPHDTDWLELAKIMVPILLNYVQCRLLAKDYYSVITKCTEVLEIEPKNVKALFRRAKAHAGAWNPIEARKDFEAVLSCDPQLQNIVQKELKLIDEEQRKRDLQDKTKLQKLFVNNNN